MRILRAESHRRMPWKNGGGETVEIAVSPAGAGLDVFEWRVSMARVERDGPFSVFPGIDRTLAIIEGEGIVLDVEGRAPLDLGRRFSPVTFPADAPTSCRLIDGPILDLNVMSRRGVVAHAVEPLALDEAVALDIAEPDTLVVCLEGEVVVLREGEEDRLRRHDCLLWEGPRGELRLTPQARATVAVITFRRA